MLVMSRLRTVATRIRLWPILSRIGREHPVALPLVRALRAAAAGRYSAEERKWIAQIEAVRQNLESVDDNIDVVDCGARADGEGSRPTVDRVVGEMCRSASKSKRWASLLMKLVREYKPQTALEMGTCMGISALYQAAGMQMNGVGHLTTLEGSPSLVKIASEGFHHFHLDNVTVYGGCFQETLGPALNKLPSIDYAFIDGHHEEAATLEYFGHLRPRMSHGSLVVLDDITWSEGMRRAWKAVEDDPAVAVSVNVGVLGLCVMGRTGEQKGKYRLAL